MRQMIFAIGFVILVGQAGASIPVERASNVFFARATINGQGPFWLTVDTGATLSVIDPGTADVLQLVTRPSDVRADVGIGPAATSVATAFGAVVRVGDMTPFRPAPIHVIGVRETETALGHRIDGVLGHDFLERYVAEFDYATDAVRLHPPGHAMPDRAEAVRVRTDENRLIVPARLRLSDGEVLEARLLVDTGSSSGVSLNTPFSARHRLEDRFPSSELSAAVGVNGMTVRAVMYVRDVSIGATNLGVERVALSRAPTGLSASAEFDGVIGAAVLRRFRLVIDYPGRRLVLERMAAPRIIPCP